MNSSRMTRRPSSCRWTASTAPANPPSAGCWPTGCAAGQGRGRRAPIRAAPPLGTGTARDPAVAQAADDPGLRGLLFMASRAELVAEVIRPALDAGQVVVSDRFLLANVVYQGHAGGLDVGSALAARPARHRRAGAGPDVRARSAGGDQPGSPRPAGRPHREPALEHQEARAAGLPDRGAAAAGAHSRRRRRPASTRCRRSCGGRCSDIARRGGMTVGWQRVRGHDAHIEGFAGRCSAAGWPTPICSSARPASASGCSPSSWPRRCCANGRRGAARRLRRLPRLHPDRRRHAPRFLHRRPAAGDGGIPHRPDARTVQQLLAQVRAGPRAR